MAREERVARPTRTDEWEVFAADKGVGEDWERWAKQEPNARDRLRPAEDWWETVLRLDEQLADLEGDDRLPPAPDRARIERWTIATHQAVRELLGEKQDP